MSLDSLQTLRGMVDLLPAQTGQWQQIEAVARDHFRRAAIQEIRTPLIEPTALFCRGIGESTDVVGKEMYTFNDRGARSCTLRPEGTASVVRAAIQHGLLSQGRQRLWYAGPMFRYERPQAGRQRQFHQIGLEFLGYSHYLADSEAISIAWDLLHDLGLKGLSLEINSLGSPDDRRIYRETLVTYLREKADQLDPEDRDRIDTNPLRILDSKHSGTKLMLAGAPTLLSTMSAASKSRFECVTTSLEYLKIPYTINPMLVRGLDYYTHTAFEITSNQLGSQATVCGGGRYDGLVEQLGGAHTPAIGWALGVERLALLISSIQGFQPSGPDVYFVNLGSQASACAHVLARDLRSLGLAVDIDPSGSSQSKQMKRALRSSATWALIITDDDVIRETITLRHLLGDKADQILSLSSPSRIIDAVHQGD